MGIIHQSPPINSHWLKQIRTTSTHFSELNINNYYSLHSQMVFYFYFFRQRRENNNTHIKLPILPVNLFIYNPKLQGATLTFVKYNHHHHHQAHLLTHLTHFATFLSHYCFALTYMNLAYSHGK